MTDTAPAPPETQSDPAVEDDARQVRPFAAVLQELPGTHVELSEALQELFDRVRETGKKGSLSITLTVERPKDGPDDVLTVVDTIGRKFPVPTRKKSLFFLDKDGNPVRDNPRQPQLPFRDVSARPETPIREAR